MNSADISEPHGHPLVRATAGAAAQARGRYRMVEWGAVICILLLQSGALLPLLVMGPDGFLDDAARSRLRMVNMPVYLAMLLLLAPHYRQVIVAVVRNLPLVLLLLLPFVSVLWSVGPSASLKRGIVLCCAMLFSFLVAIRFTPRQFMLIVSMTLGLCMVLSLAMMAIAPGLAFMPLGGELRGVFVHKNVLGWAAGFGSIIAMAMIIDRSPGMRRGGLLLLGASAACLFLSGSITGVFAAGSGAVLMAFYLLLSRSRGLGRLVLVLVFLQMVLAFLFWLQFALVPTLEALGRDATLTGRVPLWDLVDAEISRRFLLGFGYEAFWNPGHGPVWGIWGEIGWNAPHAHNGYRQTMLNFGIVGLVALLVMLLRMVRQGTALLLRAPDEGWLWINVVGGVMLMINLSESLFLAANDLPWIIFATGIVMIGLRYPEVRNRSYR